jgi:L-threonylcarbamoyladenylate synthase
MLYLFQKMKTKIFNSIQIKQAAELIKKGEVVAFPTETVYGLGANALDEKAVQKIFIAKGRPSDNPLIVHISSFSQLNEIAFVNSLAEKLAKKFWPGPLTIILKKKSIVPLNVSGGLETIAIRMPKNKIALKLIKFSKVPIAAPSANISGKPSGTSFKHVFQDFQDKIPGIIKSRDSEFGIESTVIDLTSKTPTLLRPGSLNFNLIKKIIPSLKTNIKSKKAKSPGMKYTHYSPKAKIILIEKSALKKSKDYIKKFFKNKIFIINPNKTKNISKKLFKLFRECDEKNVEYIFIYAVSEKGNGLALMDRIRKASTKTIK